MKHFKMFHCIRQADINTLEGLDWTGRCFFTLSYFYTLKTKVVKLLTICFLFYGNYNASYFYSTTFILHPWRFEDVLILHHMVGEYKSVLIILHWGVKILQEFPLLIMFYTPFLGSETNRKGLEFLTPYFYSKKSVAGVRLLCFSPCKTTLHGSKTNRKRLEFLTPYF